MENFLKLETIPARLTIEQAAWLLGFAAHEMTILMAKGLLKPLGHPAQNGQKFFLAATIEDLRRDEKWFSKASDAVLDYWRNKNARKGRNTQAMGVNAGRDAASSEFVEP